jgi:hypothetical protein
MLFITRGGEGRFVEVASPSVSFDFKIAHGLENLILPCKYLVFCVSMKGQKQRSSLTSVELILLYLTQEKKKNVLTDDIFSKFFGKRETIFFNCRKRFVVRSRFKIHSLVSCNRSKRHQRPLNVITINVVLRVCRG